MIPASGRLLSVLIDGAENCPSRRFALRLARRFGLLPGPPLATRLGLTGVDRAGVAGALTLLLLPLLMAQLAPAPPIGARLAMLAVKEGLIGFLLGVIFPYVSG